MQHTKLEVKFDWSKAYLYGKATIDIKPHYYKTDSVILDAKGFDINSVELVGKSGNKSLEYEYVDSLLLKIKLDREYTRDEVYTLFIDYTAKPDELPEGGGEAISDRKGLYFINPNNAVKDKPQQIWTQGEPESSSCWFPTIDSPNQNTSQEIIMTVQDKYITLSNGVLLSSKKDGKGMRTDHWKQETPHAPYLFMMAVGDFAMIPDKWKNLEVNYYVEPAYEKDAKAIFGKTPKMLTLFSEQLRYPYPWDKYSQIVVRDYVSGAMENTTAVVFGEFAQNTTRQLLDFDVESIVAHELFHHWFGDLVTCESWANLPLNESFATYSEYLWYEAEYGDYEADHELANKLRSYLREARGGHKDMIRFYHEKPLDMFDSHSYAKGGCILHMLRMELGDEAFFDGLSRYLHDNKHQSVEIHNLRLAMEKVTGQDLNWFFNQWFLAKGHPELDIKYGYDEDAQVATVTVSQNQDLKELPLYRLPVWVDVYMPDGSMKHEKVVVTQKEQTFKFPAKVKPSFINFDADKALVCEKEENKSPAELMAQYKRAPKYLDKMEALKVISKQERSPEVIAIMQDALKSDFWGIRRYAISNYKFTDWEKDGDFLAALENIVKNDPKSRVRSTAINKLAKTNNGDYTQLFRNAFEKDQSYSVMNAGLNALSGLDGKQAMELATKNEDNQYVIPSVLGVYAKHAEAGKEAAFENAYKNVSNAGTKWAALEQYSKYIVRFDDKSLDRGLALFEDAAMTADPWWLKMGAIRSIMNVSQHFTGEKEAIEAQLAGASDAEKTKLEAQLEKVTKRTESTTGLIQKIMSSTKDANLLKNLGGMMMGQ